ncbi:MAG: Maf family protein [Planctomycetes bacterium]|nr:Maf family protein [Planctomycetota bacterium]
MARHLSVVRNTCQRVVTAVAEPQAAAQTLARFPGVQGLQLLIQGFRGVGEDEANVAAALAAVEQYDQLIRDLAGSQSKLVERLNAVAPVPARVRSQTSEAAEIARQRLFAAAAEVAGRTSGATVIACDTLVECQGQVLGKPEDENHAREMLELLSGSEHRVYSGLCLWPAGSNEPKVRVASTTLRMDVLTQQQLDEYLATGLWRGKAGAFGYQDRLGWVHIVEGSESNVVGLPMELLAEMLG